MHYGNIKKTDIANGEGVRVSLFVSGCRNKCKNCFNKETWSFDFGNEFDLEAEKEILSSLSHSYIKGFSLLGGEPFEEENQRELVKLLKKIKQQYPQKDIWCYTGYLFDKDLIKGGKKFCEATDEMLGYIDILVDGKFEEEKKDLKLKFRGSSNQRIIDLRNKRDISNLI